MFLKTLTMRGFKSFADKTELSFEPGVTVIVGPNGSGKSNVVDALSWVLGSASPKNLRGASMADVIFAGTGAKPALGRASVAITIDNTAGTLPIDYSEVTVSRAMFASGENEYAINNTPCRLLDVQELLSDTGLGRENHTIVGQGKLDAILAARPEDRRVFVEEAAGILKHRRRKDRAVRKLAQVDDHLDRLHDVLRELRRSLRPLERQAEAARKHAELQAALAEVTRTRAVRELAGLTRRWRDEQDDAAEAGRRLAANEAELRQAKARESELETLLEALQPQVREAGETHFRLANLVERFRGLTERIEERRQGLLAAVEEPVAGRDPADLRARAAQQRAARSGVEREQERAGQALAEAEARRAAAERARRAHEQAAAAEARRRAEARERALRWEGEVSAVRGMIARAAGEEGRLASQAAGLAERHAELQADLAAVDDEIRRLDAAGGGIADAVEQADGTLRRCVEAVDDAARRERELERRRAWLEARADALRAASAEATAGSHALLRAADGGTVEGLLGPLAEHLEVEEGMADAVAAALGPLGDALVVTDRAAACNAVGFVRDGDCGRVLLLAAQDPDATGGMASDGPAPEGARPLIDALSAPPRVHAALRRALAGAFAVDDLPHACRLSEVHPQRVFVTRAGDVAGPRGYAGGSAGTASAVLSRAAAEQAQEEAAQVAEELAHAQARVRDAERARDTARRERDAATSARQESAGASTSAGERQRRLRKELTSCERERGVVAAAQDELAADLDAQRQRLAALEARGPQPQVPEPEGPDLEAERLDDLLRAAREAEVDARLVVSAVQQRAAEIDRVVAALEREADEVDAALADRERRRRARLDAVERCGQLAAIAARGLRRGEASLAQAVTDRDRLEAQRSACDGDLGVARARLRDAEAALGAVREQRHADDLRRADLRHRLDAVRDRLRDGSGVDPDEALAAAGDDVLDGGEERDRELAEEQDRLARKLGLLGTVNPLALDEFHGLQERHRFLTGQIDDLKASRRDLLEVVTAVDERVRDLFSTAFADVAAAFEELFPRLFPGGRGRLVLTDPDDPLTTGIEVEARPPGKRVKRLSLLSGGERALTALAVLFAIFAARPSPFYVLDEVEAALDDVNLQRFLRVVTDFRASSQLLIVTHQKRTMEIADCLYGVSMQGDGLSQVISQRLREPEPATTA